MGDACARQNVRGRLANEMEVTAVRWARISLKLGRTAGSCSKHWFMRRRKSGDIPSRSVCSCARERGRESGRARARMRARGRRGRAPYPKQAAAHTKGDRERWEPVVRDLPREQLPHDHTVAPHVHLGHERRARLLVPDDLGRHPLCARPRATVQQHEPCMLREAAHAGDGRARWGRPCTLGTAVGL